MRNHGAGPGRRRRRRARGRARRAAARIAAALLLAAGAGPPPAAGDPPCEGRDPLRRPFFGDLHVHTRYSLDAWTQGTRNGPRDAYRFARGEPLGVQPYDAAGRSTRTLRLRRPLDFAAVTDHAELFGELTLCESPGLPGYDSFWCRLHRGWPRASFFVMNTLTSYFERPSRRGFCGEEGAACRAAAATPWRVMQEAAEAFQDRSPACTFSTFIGYEWTGGAGSRNLHRNVLFRSAAVPDLPIDYIEEPTPKGLWRALRRACLDAGTGCDVLAIPHNANLSDGSMFRLPPDLDADGARLRAAMEPLVEIMQHKGDSECLPDVGAQDELCAFEKLPYQHFAGKFVPWLASPPPEASFVRHALGQGLLALERTGENPLQLGLVASTDTHLGAAGLVDESAGHPGHGGAGAPAAAALPEGLPDDVEFNPGGLAVLWAEENRRDALFDAMRRREAYGTSGPRIVVRVFGGWNLPADACRLDGRAFAAAGYAGGVPMGGVLEPPAPEGAGPHPRPGPPRFAIWALRDAGTAEAPGTPLERVQIVKGWIEDGVAREAVIDVAGRPDAGDAVDPATCRAPGGADALCAVWQDDDFDPDAPAFWYVRVVERPTCRWHTRWCRSHGIDCAAPGGPPEALDACCDPAIPTAIRERAWTSPIWYQPGRGRAAPPARASARGAPP